MNVFEKKIKKIRDNFLKALGLKKADLCVRAVEEIITTQTGHQLYEEVPVFKVEEKKGSIGSASEIGIKIPEKVLNAYYYKELRNFLVHEPEHVRQLHFGYLDGEEEGGSLEELFIQNKATEGAAKTVEDIVSLELEYKADKDGFRFLSEIKKEGEDVFFQKSGAGIFTSLMSEKCPYPEWRSFYSTQAFFNIGLTALEDPQKITKKGNRKLHEQIIQKYTGRFGGFLKEEDIDKTGFNSEEQKMAEELRYAVRKLKKHNNAIPLICMLRQLQRRR